jgi:feruloyl-CoA synthase
MTLRASPVRSEPLFATPHVIAERRADGTIRLRSAMPLQATARCVGDWLEHWARQAPDRIFLADRASVEAPWRTVTYGAALRQVRSIASWILAQGMSADRPLVILSDNGVDHALFALAAMHVGVPTASISPAYSLVSRDFDKLKRMIALLEPGAIYVSSENQFASALAAIAPLHRAVVVASDGEGALSFQAVANTPESPAVAKAFAAVTPDTIAKFLFTSGSTGTPKAVINTQRMLTSSQQAKAQTWTFLEHVDDLVILDWLPWPSAPTTISIWCCAMAARSMSTAASRRRGCFRPRSPISEASCRRCISTCRAASTC